MCYVARTIIFLLEVSAGVVVDVIRKYKRVNLLAFGYSFCKSHAFRIPNLNTFTPTG